MKVMLITIENNIKHPNEKTQVEQDLLDKILPKIHDAAMAAQRAINKKVPREDLILSGYHALMQAMETVPSSIQDNPNDYCMNKIHQAIMMQIQNYFQYN